MILVSFSSFQIYPSVWSRCFPYCSFFLTISNCKKTCSSARNWVCFNTWENTFLGLLVRPELEEKNDGSVQDPERSGHHLTVSALGKKTSVCGITSGCLDLCVFVSQVQCPALQFCAYNALHHKLLSLHTVQLSKRVLGLFIPLWLVPLLKQHSQELWKSLLSNICPIFSA